jgi:hypothetical protein
VINVILVRRFSLHPNFFYTYLGNSLWHQHRHMVEMGAVHMCSRVGRGRLDFFFSPKVSKRCKFMLHIRCVCVRACLMCTCTANLGGFAPIFIFSFFRVRTNIKAWVVRKKRLSP